MTDWLERAECKNHPDVDFFPERGADVSAALAVCERCPVAAQCLTDALVHGERDGIWGATTGRQRRRLLARRRHLCVDCHADIGHKSGTALYCDGCSKARAAKRRSDARRRSLGFTAVGATAGPRAKPLRRTG